MAKRSSKAHDQAEASFKKKEERLREGAQAMAEYRAAGNAVDAKTARLKSLRLAKEEADRAAKLSDKPAPSKSKPVAAGKKTAAAGKKAAHSKSKPVMSRKKQSLSPAD